MRRAQLSSSQLKMEVQNQNQNQLNAFVQLHLANSQFAQKLLGIPMFKAAVDTAGGAYVKVKDSNALVGKSIELALNLSSAVVDKLHLAPIAEKGLSAATPITSKVDEYAAKGLDSIIARVPVINEQPQEIVQNTKTAIAAQVGLLNGYTEACLKTWPVQSAMDVYEAILSTACTTLDNVLPEGSTAETDEKGSSAKNGTLPTKEALSEEDKHKRGLLLAQRTLQMFSSAFRRLFGKCQTQMENAVQATDLALKQVRGQGQAMGDNANSTSTPAEVNGDANLGGKGQKKNKSKTNKNGMNE